MKYIIYVLLIGLIIPGVIGCDDNNGGGQGVGSMPPEPLTGCTPLSTNPCTILINNGDYYSCIVGSAQTCAVDLMSVLNAISTFTTVTGDTTMWIEVWGGNGGATDKGTGGGTGGYAITTTTVNDIAGINNGSTVIYYFLGSNGANGGDHCGSAGGSSTIVTLEDLMLNPSSDPTQTSPPILLVAGGAGGGCGGNDSFGCFAFPCNAPGGNAGIAIASLNTIGSGAGIPESGGDMGTGGPSLCDECGGGNETSGMNGYGGLGGAGGSGQSCSGPGGTGFRNTPEVGFSDGQGGKGSSNTSACDAGGGGGGGGWGGGGGGGHGNDNGGAWGGGGGGSFAIASTVSSDLSPTSEQANPCGTGCLRISFAP